MSFALSTAVELDFDQTVVALREALAAQGFGILTEVDLSGTLKTKLGVEVPRELLLGACNPAYAYRALQAEERVGLLLPCSFTVRAGGSGDVGPTLVDAVDPGTMVELTGNTALSEVAAEVRSGIRAALDTIASR